jgi:hypothetical protein
MQNNLSIVGGHGLSAVIGKTTNLTDSWYDLQKFISIGGVGQTVDVSGYTVPISNSTISSNTGRNPMYSGVPTVSSGTNPIIPPRNTTIPATVQPTDYGNNFLNMGVGNLIGGNSNNSLAGTLLRGVQIGNFTDGSALGNILNNALGLLAGWAFNKLSFVIGFSNSSILSSLLKAFGTQWNGLILAGTNSLLGGSGGLNFLGTMGATRGNPTSLDNQYSVSAKTGYGVHFFDVRAGEGDRYTFRYAEVTQAMRDYFKYKGCNGQMITKHYAGLTWTQDAYYSTRELETHRDEKEIQMWKDLYNADYSDLEESINLIKNEFNINIERETLFVNFNRYRVPVPDHELNLTRSYIFFTRPDLNLSYIQPNQDAMKTARVPRMYPLFGNIMKSHPVLCKYLMGNDAGVNHEFIPILTHACTGIEIGDEVLETTEVGETFTGLKYTYGKSLIKSKTAGTVNCTFRDDDMLSIYKIMKVWCEYISAVYRGEMLPKDQYRDWHVLDYATSIYYFLCKANDTSEILFWTKYTGCYPTSIPSSNFADSLGSPVKMPTYSIAFNYARKDDYNPLHIAEFNSLCSDTNYEYIPNYNPDTLHINKSFVGPPFVDTNDGSRLFRLKFRPR